MSAACLSVWAACPANLLAVACSRGILRSWHARRLPARRTHRVWDRDALYNNSEEVAACPLKSLAKLAYYHAFALLYGAMGAFAQVGVGVGRRRRQCCARWPAGQLGCVRLVSSAGELPTQHCAPGSLSLPPLPHAPLLQVVMVNSSWTRRHIVDLWWQWNKPARVYPPCDTRALQALPLDRRLKRVYLLSIAQFRPEKDHAMQLRALAAARRKAAGMHDGGGEAVLAAHLKLVGSCRNAEDEQRIQQLKGG